MKRVLVAGELNADLVVSGLSTLPVLGRELLGDSFTMTLGSSSAITAARLAMLTHDDADITIDFVGLMGDDDIGHFVLAQLQHYGVNVEQVEYVDAPTGITIALTYSRDRALLTVPGAMTLFDGAALTPAFLRRYTHLHIGAFYLQPGLQPHIARIFTDARAQGLTTSLDVGWDPAEQWLNNPHLAPALRVTDDFFPNSDEAAALSSEPKILAGLVGGTLTIKQGCDGATAYCRNHGGWQTTHAAAFPVEVVDTTGAGDAFNAGYLYAHRLQGKPCAEALTFAAACGAQAVMQRGGATNAPTAADVYSFIQDKSTVP